MLIGERSCYLHWFPISTWLDECSVLAVLAAVALFAAAASLSAAGLLAWLSAEGSRCGVWFPALAFCSSWLSTPVYLYSFLGQSESAGWFGRLAIASASALSALLLGDVAALDFAWAALDLALAGREWLVLSPVLPAAVALFASSRSGRASAILCSAILCHLSVSSC